MYEDQQGLCALDGCTNPPECVDHDHSCCPGKRSCGGCVRGLTCKNCNLMLGFAEDSESKLLGGAAYIRKTQRQTGAIIEQELPFDNAPSKE